LPSPYLGRAVHGTLGLGMFRSRPGMPMLRLGADTD
jgi:hypothetical protein